MSLKRLVERIRNSNKELNQLKIQERRAIARVDLALLREIFQEERLQILRQALAMTTFLTLILVIKKLLLCKNNPQILTRFMILVTLITSTKTEKELHSLPLRSSNLLRVERRKK